MMRFAISLTLAVALLSVAPALASQSDEQAQARKDSRAGNVRKLSDIERRVPPMMPL